MKFKTYKGETLHNVEVSYKIDGVRAEKVGDAIVSRSGKPLYNISMSCSCAEIYVQNWETTVSRVRTIHGTPVEEEYVYSLTPLDSRLFIGTYETLTKEDVDVLFSTARSLGKEGLILNTGTVRYKVKGMETHDVVVTGLLPGQGKYTGKLGAFITDMGNVGTGLSDKQRLYFNTPDTIGKVIEVSCMELTKDGKFRHPRFIRERFDK